jgi:hypothetical protein
MQTVGGGRDTAADVADPHRCAIAIGDDDILERLGLDNLVIALEGQAGRNRVVAALTNASVRRQIARWIANRGKPVLRSRGDSPVPRSHRASIGKRKSEKLRIVSEMQGLLRLRDILVFTASGGRGAKIFMRFLYCWLPIPLENLCDKWHLSGHAACPGCHCPEGR